MKAVLFCLAIVAIIMIHESHRSQRRYHQEEMQMLSRIEEQTSKLTRMIPVESDKDVQRPVFLWEEGTAKILIPGATDE